MLTRRFSLSYYDATNGLGNRSILQIIGVYFVIRIYSAYTPLFLMSLVSSTVIIPTIIAQPAKRLNTVLRPQGIEGVHLTGASHSPDLWYPYLWMLGGQILKMKSGHPTKGSYWFPAYNSSEGVRAMNFIKQQVDAGIKPQKNHFWGLEFLDRRFAVMIEHKELAWKLIELMLAPKSLHSFLLQGGFLPTQISMGNNDLLNSTASSYPYYRQLVSMIPFGGIRPSIPEYPQIADNIRQAIYEVQFENEDPKLALAQAASKSAKILGW